MEHELIQRTRYLLEARVRRVRVCSLSNIEGACSILWNWIRSTTVVWGIVRHLEDRAEAIWADAKALHTLAEEGREVQTRQFTTEEDLAATGLASVRNLASAVNDPETAFAALRMVHLLFEGPSYSFHVKEADLLEVFRDQALDALAQYIDEHLDDRNVMLGILRRYKVRCERFRKHRLRTVASQGLEKLDGERALAVDLYEYLHDQGIEFMVEPKAGAGEPDLIAHRSAARELLADAKYLRPELAPSEIKSVMFEGLRQVLDYCKEESRAIGYLIVFSEANRILEFKTMYVDDVYPCVRIEGTTIYYLVIDIGDLPPASKRGRAEKVVIDLAEAITAATA